MKTFDAKPWLVSQPVIIIGTYDQKGHPNAMNAAWAGTWDMKQIMISLGNHATTHNLNTNNDFTVAFATAKTLKAADYVGIVSANNDPDKMSHTGWTAVKGKHVNAPIFTDFPMTMECRVNRKLDESDSGYYLIADVIDIIVDEAYIANDGKPDLEQMELVTFDPIHHSYIQLGHKIGNAFSIGKQLK